MNLIKGSIRGQGLRGVVNEVYAMLPIGRQVDKTSNMMQKQDQPENGLQPKGLGLNLSLNDGMGNYHLLLMTL
jgi:hypothetical protein